MNQMSATFEIFDVETANQIGTYDTVEEALRVINDALGRVGPEAIANLALGREDEVGDTEVVARGDDLLRLALAASQSKTRRVPA